MKQNSALTRNLVRFAAAATALVAGESLAISEASIYYVDDHSSDAACGGSNFQWGDKTAGYLADKLRTWNWDRVYEKGNLWVDFRDFADVDENSDGNDAADPAGIDSADLGFIYTHGSSGGCDTDKAYSRISMGDGDTTCKVQYGNQYGGNDVQWGDTDLNIMILDACRTLQKCVFNDGGYFVAENNLGALLGFHGVSFDRRSHTNRFEDFVDASRYDGLGDNWVDEMNAFVIGGNNDECGTVVTFGADSDDADYTFQWGGIEDWKTVTGHGTSCYYYISGCDPKSGDPL